MGLFRRKKPLSRTRRVLRGLVWLAFAGVVMLRWMTPSEPMPSFRFGPMGMGGGQDFNGQWRRYRAPATLIHPAKTLPADLYRIEIEVSRRDEEKLEGYQWNGWPGRGGGGGQERPEALVTVREGGRVYTNVALHLKGSAGSFRPYGDKPAMTLNFSKHAKGQKFHGYSKFSLNNSVQDPTFLSEAICRELFEKAGVPAPRVEHATVVLNGRDLNLYVLSEGWGKPFLKRFFGNVDGNLYEGGFVQDITEDLEVNSGDEPRNREPLDALVAAAMQSSAADRWAQLNQVLDMDRFLTFLALEVMTCHWDGYSLNRNNYRIFHDRTSGKLIFLPHGLDQTFGVGRSSPTASIQPGMEGIVARAVTSTPEGRKRYLDRIATLRSNVFLEVNLTNRLWTLAKRLEPTLAAYSPEWAARHQAEVEEFSGRILERARSISDQLTAPQESLTFSEDGIARIKGWRPSVNGGTRESVSFSRAEVDGIRQLRIAAAASGGVGSWRTRVTLEPGRYRFDGRVRLRGVGANGGVCLRLSGVRMPVRLLRTEDWEDLGFEFELGEILTEVELICELRSAGGEAFFDEGSLRLVRVP